RNSKDSTAPEEPPEVTEMDIPLLRITSKPRDPEHRRMPTPDNCTAIIYKETSRTRRCMPDDQDLAKILQGAISSGITDPTHPIIMMGKHPIWAQQRKTTKSGYLSITVEGFESRGSNQCFQCNQFNHTAEHCHLTPKCLKCGDKRKPETARLKSWTRFCVNCQVRPHGQLQ
ncbi:hypothetical protein TNCV_3241021, partial [Trichonephila clavipes]